MTGILYKVDPDPELEKNWRLYQNSLYKLKNLFLANLRVLIADITILSLNVSPKIPK